MTGRISAGLNAHPSGAFEPTEFARHRDVIALKDARHDGRDMWRKYKTLFFNEDGASQSVEFIKHPVFSGTFGRFYVGNLTSTQTLVLANASPTSSSPRQAYSPPDFYPVGVKEMRLVKASPRPKAPKAHVRNHDKYHAALKPIALSSFENIAREVAIMHAVDPRNVIAWGKRGKYAYVVMKLHYGDLDTAMQDLFHVRNTTLPGITDAEVARFILREGVLALRKLSDRKLVHGDLKPENMLLDKRNMRVRLSDFGMTRPSGEAVAVFGTAAYFAHEQRCAWLKNDRDARLGRSADVQALALSVIKLMTGAFMMPELPKQKGTQELGITNAYEDYHRSYKQWRQNGAAAGLQHVPYSQDASVRRFFTIEQHMYNVDEELADVLWRMLDPTPGMRPSVNELLRHRCLQESPRITRQISYAAAHMRTHNARIAGYLNLLNHERFKRASGDGWLSVSPAASSEHSGSAPKAPHS